jgi:glycosyltransferase involved in cell wall biosynthesis
MRVLNVLGELRFSGGEVMLRDAVPALRQAGIEPLVMATGDQLGEFASAYQHLGVAVVHLPLSRDLAFARAFYRLIRNLSVDVVHIHTERANAAMALVSRAAGARVVRTVHSVFAYEGRLRLVRSGERKLLTAVGVKHVAISDSVARNEHLRLRNTTQRIDNWIGPRFRPPSLAERANARLAYKVDEPELVLVSVGSCSDVKNHGAILAALPLLARNLKRPLVYLHAGMGADMDKEREFARTLDRTAIEVRFLGTVHDVRPLLWAADVFCMPSRYEGVGIAALEALACAVPSVLANVDGLSDTHPAAASVRFVTPDASGVAEGIAGVVSRDDVRSKALGVAQNVRQERSIEHRVAELVEVYRSN